MGFWNLKGSQPKRQYRWVMNIGGIPQWLVKKTAKPSFSVTEAKHSYLNHTFYWPGRVEYEKIDITLVDPIVPDATAMMWNILYHSGYNVPDNPNDVVTVHKNASVDSLGAVTISQLAGNGQTVEETTFSNAWIAGVKFGELDYEGDNLIDLTLSLRYDFVEVFVKGDTTWDTLAPAADAPSRALETEERTNPVTQGS